MLDFYKIDVSPKKGKAGGFEISPGFIVDNFKDLMIRGGRFYSVYDEETGFWKTNELEVARLVDKDLWEKYDELSFKDKDESYIVKSMKDYNSRSWKNFQLFIRDCPDNYHQLDNHLIFANQKVVREDYASHALPYDLKKGSIESYEELISTLYSPEEREKIEWAIGSIIKGDSRHIQKFLVFYGESGAGKSTVLRIIEWLFEGYFINFDAKSLGSSSNAFATEQFRSNPLVAIEHDTDLSRIEDNTKFNSIVSHEGIIVNEKYKTQYTMEINTFMFLGTNQPVKITDAKSGLLRRLIVVEPTGRLIPNDRYQVLMDQIKFELGAIAYHCLRVYESLGKNHYADYVPEEMMYQTNIFVNFVEELHYTYLKVENQEWITLNRAWDMFKKYCSDTGYDRPPMKKYEFKSELKNYFKEYKKDAVIDGMHYTNIYSGFKLFKKDIVDYAQAKVESKQEMFTDLSCQDSIFDSEYGLCQAQYSNRMKKWDNVTTQLKDLDTHLEHFVRAPRDVVMIDFDIKGPDGKKDRQKNLEAVRGWKPTYAEYSRGGEGVHLYYIYDGDVDKLANSYAEDIEIKTYKNAFRRKLVGCNNLPLAVISSGLPLKEEKKVINKQTVKNESNLRKLIQRNLEKDIHPGTKPSIDFIYKILEDAYNSGLVYNVEDLRPKILAFAANSSNHPDYCINLVNKMRFKSEEVSLPDMNYDDDKIIFYDVEVFPNLFLVNWKVDGIGDDCVRMINPQPEDIDELLRFKLVGFNCRRYDNHILYARHLGYTNEQLYNLSMKIISGDRNAFFGEAYNVSYTDVYDFSSKKQSLKKWEIELGIHHKELGLPWDEPVPEDRWTEVAEYCDNDVIATEKVFHHLVGDWTARQILADVAEMTVNDTTNSLTTRIIFGKNRKPQDEFNYRNLAEPVTDISPEEYTFLEKARPNMMKQMFDPESILPYFPGYKFDAGISTYRGEKVGEGGYVYAEPGMYYNVALLDVASMHPSSLIDEDLFGNQYTTRFKELVDGRLYIKHKDYDSLSNILDGKIGQYVERIKEGSISAKDLSYALKIAINSVYGLTSAKFENPFRDIRNKDNIVAKRGALFMIDLKHEVQARGFTVAHIKTDSIKIPNATPEIIQFVMDFGERYGYIFEHEATYEKMCLVNDAVYICKYKDGDWSATGAQFQHPYVFKKLFSHDVIDFRDLCETKSVKSEIYLDMNEDLPEGEHNLIFVGRVGSFCPIQEGHGGGELVRSQKMKDSDEIKYYSVTGTKGFRWMESENVETLHLEEWIDYRYFDDLCQAAIDNISQYGDFEAFVSDIIPPWEGEDKINRKENQNG